MPTQYPHNVVSWRTPHPRNTHNQVCNAECHVNLAVNNNCNGLQHWLAQRHTPQQNTGVTQAACQQHLPWNTQNRHHLL